MDDDETLEGSFTRFVREERRNLERAVAARTTPSTAVDAVADALEVAWRRWPSVRAMENPVGYVYRIAQRRAVRMHRWRPQAPADETLVEPTGDVDDLPDPELTAALGRLSRRQRQVVLLVTGFGFTYDEAASMLGITSSSLRNHLERAMTRLRREIHHTEEAP